jgi:hypothetical protein
METADTLSRTERRLLIDAICNAIREGFPPPSRSNKPGVKTAYQRAAEVLGKSDRQVVEGIYRARKLGEVPDWSDIAARTKLAEPETPWIERPNLPSGDVPIGDLIEGLTQRSDRLLAAHSARSWFKINVRAKGPFGVAWLGDPHMDSPGCNWRLLRRDIDIIKRTEGLFAANCGDSIDNWCGRLIALKGKSFVTDEEAWRLVEWLIQEIGEANWLLWLLGNHDSWNGTEHLWKRVCKNLIHMADWQARFEIVPPNGRGCKVWAAHSFNGHSMWNPLHGGQRAAKFSGGKANLLIQGHHHEWALFSTENHDSKSIYWLAKARGYKFADDYGEHHGYFPQDGGASIVSVIDPDSPTEAGFVQCFPDLEAGADYLAFKRRKAAA